MGGTGMGKARLFMVINDDSPRSQALHPRWRSWVAVAGRPDRPKKTFMHFYAVFVDDDPPGSLS